MTDREKVIKGLETCVNHQNTGFGEIGCNHSGCLMIENGNCIIDIMPEIIALLKSQEPRVMTLEEVQTLRVNDVVWLEDKGKQNIIPGIARNRHLWPHSATMVTNFMRGDGCKVTADDDDYGKRWRCWTSCPTDEQRSETPWK